MIQFGGDSVIKDKRQALLDVAILQGVKNETLQKIAALSLTFPERNKRYEPKAGELALLLSGSAKISRASGRKSCFMFNTVRAHSRSKPVAPPE